MHHLSLYVFRNFIDSSKQNDRLNAKIRFVQWNIKEINIFCTGS